MTTKSWKIAGITILASLTVFIVPALAHHSFAMYDQNKTVTLTGVVTQFVAQANHAELHFYAVGPDGKLMKDAAGKNVSWGVEMAGAAAVAQQGITATSFGAGTVFSVKMNPLRDGTNYGSRIGAIAKCPVDSATNKPKIPAVGKHCDSVPGNTLIGGNAF
jgi:hypothetical protein